METTAIAAVATLEATALALKERNFEPIIIETKEEALEKIKALIPSGASVTNGASRTLEQIGYIDYLKSGQHPWKNLHGKIVAEQDPQKQQALRRQAALSDYYLGSVHALAQSGEMIIASNSGSQLPNIVYSSPNIIFVVGVQKITASLPDAYQRLVEQVIPLEDVRMKQVYGPQSGTKLNKVVVLHGEPAYTGRKITVLLVKEELGF